MVNPRVALHTRQHHGRLSFKPQPAPNIRLGGRRTLQDGRSDRGASGRSPTAANAATTPPRNLSGADMARSMGEEGGNADLPQA